MTTRPTPLADSVADIGASIFVAVFALCICVLLVAWTAILVKGFAIVIAHAVGALT